MTQRNAAQIRMHRAELRYVGFEHDLRATLLTSCRLSPACASSASELRPSAMKAVPSKLKKQVIRPARKDMITALVDARHVPLTSQCLCLQFLSVAKLDALSVVCSLLRRGFHDR